MLTVDAIDLSYGASQILRRVSLTARMGEVTCVLGRNGVGKTSLLRAIFGLNPIRSGHISMWSYAKPIFESIRSYQYPELRIYCDCAPTAGFASTAAQAPAMATAAVGDAGGGAGTGNGARHSFR